MLLDVSPYTEPLSRTPAILRLALEGRTDDWLDRRHAADVVSPRETVAHLLLCEAEENWIMRIQHLLDPQYVIPAGPYSGVGDVELTAAKPLAVLLDEFDVSRAQSLRELSELGLTTTDLEKSLTEPDFGTQTVGNVLAAWVAHDQYHLGQVFKSFSAPYVDKIGPYQQFLNLPHFN